MSKDSEALHLQTWMSELPEQLKDIPLIYLAIPGSHDSMTYGITRASEIAPDAEPIVKSLYPLFRGTILRWTITQALDAWHQLLIGIRYFDLRLATKKGESNFYFTHGVYANEISKDLEQIKRFVETHPGEVVILDCQHFYGFSPEDHQRLIRYLIDLYGSKLVARRADSNTYTLNAFSRSNQQVIVVYRNESVYPIREFWTPQMLPSPWPQTDKISRLVSYLKHVRRQAGCGFVHQAVLTPTPGFIVLRWISTLREKCAVPVKDQVLPVLEQFSPGKPTFGNSTAGISSPVNVVIADFVELDDAAFPKTIIQLNMKLLRNMELMYHNYG